MEQLGEASRTTLGVAACIGGRFTVELLERVRGTSRAQVVDALWPAVELGLVISHEAAELPALVQGSGSVEGACSFTHDRVQQAAARALDETERDRVHGQVARVYLATPGVDSFTLAGQLARGCTVVHDAAERVEWAGRLLDATEEALQAAAPESASDFARAGRHLLGEEAWTLEPDLCYRLHLEGAAAASLSGDFPLADALHQTLAVRATAPAQRIAAAEARLDSSCCRDASTKPYSSGWSASPCSG